jgi:predicted dehydrogenase
MPPFTRRQFLEESLLAAAATVGTAPVERVLAEEKPSRSPSERLSVAVIGVRGRGQDHAHALAACNNCEVTCVCDADQDIGRAFAEKFTNPGGSHPRFVQDLRTVFDDKSVDVVAIATPNHWHSLAAIWAMQAGKDVYVEKPVSHNVFEGRAMVEAARKHNRLCQGGHQYRSCGSNRAAAEYIRKGKLGKIKLARCVMHRTRNPIGPPGDYQPPPGLDYNLWAGPAPMSRVTRKSFHYDWHWFWDWGNGEIGANNVHPIDTMRLILDLHGLGRGVLSYGGRVRFHDAAETANTQVAIHDFGDLTLVQEVRNLKSPPPRYGGFLLVVGTEGYLVGNLRSNSVFDPSGKLIEKLEGPDEDHFANFIKAVRSRHREDLAAEIQEGHLSAALIHVANISYRLGRPTAPADIVRQLESLKSNENALETFELTKKHLADNKVDIDKERLTLGPWLQIDTQRECFLDNRTADALATHEYRRPFVLP